MHLVGVCITKRNMGHITGALWWICTPICEGCNTKLRGQTGQKAQNF